MIPPEPPQNGEYLLAAYVVTPVILVGYLGLLWHQARKIVSGERKPER